MKNSRRRGGVKFVKLNTNPFQSTSCGSMAWPSLSWMVCCACRIPLLWWGRNLWIYLTIDWYGTNLLVDVLCVCSVAMVNTWEKAFYRMYYPCQASLTGRPKTEAQPFQTTLVPNCAHTGKGNQPKSEPSYDNRLTRTRAPPSGLISLPFSRKADHAHPPAKNPCKVARPFHSAAFRASSNHG